MISRVLIVVIRFIILMLVRFMFYSICVGKDWVRCIGIKFCCLNLMVIKRINLRVNRM